jgi:hypothetical protein
VTLILKVRLALAIIGIVVWGYGIAQDEPNVRLVGIAVLALSLVLRFTPKRFHGKEDSAL